MIRLLVTGASGFVGRALVAQLSKEQEFEVHASSRSRTAPLAGVSPVASPQLGPDASWDSAVAGIDTVIHTAARVHVRHDLDANAIIDFRRVNAAGTLRLAQQAADANVRRFVFLSTIKVNGEKSNPGLPFRANGPANPKGAYAISKYEAEEGLWEIHRETGMDIVIIRPPLIYGPGVKANFETLLRWVSRGVPLPFAGVDNRRSLVALDNLVDFIKICCTMSEAANKTWLVSDGVDLSTPELLTRLGVAFNKSTRLFLLPAGLLQKAASVVGRGEQAQRLFDSLQVDISTTCETLNWSAPWSIDDALQATVRHFSKGRLA